MNSRIIFNEANRFSVSNLYIQGSRATTVEKETGKIENSVAPLSDISGTLTLYLYKIRGTMEICKILLNNNILNTNNPTLLDNQNNNCVHCCHYIMLRSYIMNGIHYNTKCYHRPGLHTITAHAKIIFNLLFIRYHYREILKYEFILDQIIHITYYGSRVKLLAYYTYLANDLQYNKQQL